jgi:hypothetical protein
MEQQPDPESADAEIERLRAENARLAAEVAEAEPAPSHRGRKMGAIALLVVGSMLAPISVLAVWTRSVITDTDRYVETVAPLAADPALQAVVAQQVTDALFAQVDVSTLVSDALPENQQFLAGPLTTAIRTVVQQTTARLLETDQFQQLWERANEVAHTTLAAVITGEGTDRIDTQNGTVSVDLGGVITAVNERLQDAGVDLFANFTPSGDIATIEVFQSDEIQRVQAAFSLFDKLATVLPILSVLCLIGGAILFPNRRRGLMWAGFGLAASVLALLLILSVGRTFYLGAIPSDVMPQDAAAAFFDTIVRFLRQSARVLVALGVIVFLGAIVMGPSPAAVRLRRLVGSLLGRVGDEADERGIDFGPVGEFVSRNLNALRIAVGVIGALVLVAWDQPSAMVVFVTLIIGLVVLGVLEVVGRGAAPAAPVAPGSTDPA